jgi:hypothetical protein
VKSSEYAAFQEDETCAGEEKSYSALLAKFLCKFLRRIHSRRRGTGSPSNAELLLAAVTLSNIDLDGKLTMSSAYLQAWREKLMVLHCL